MSLVSRIKILSYIYELRDRELQAIRNLANKGLFLRVKEDGTGLEPAEVVMDKTDKIDSTSVAPDYDEGTSYVTGDVCTRLGVRYRCTGATTGNFDPLKWEQEDVEAELSQKASINHASTTEEFGVGDADKYGHLKAVDTIPTRREPVAGASVTPKFIIDHLEEFTFVLEDDTEVKKKFVVVDWEEPPIT